MSYGGKSCAEATALQMLTRLRPPPSISKRLGLRREAERHAAFVRAMGFRIFDCLPCARKRRRRCTLPAQSKTFTRLRMFSNLAKRLGVRRPSAAFVRQDVSGIGRSATFRSLQHARWQAVKNLTLTPVRMLKRRERRAP